LQQAEVLQKLAEDRTESERLRQAIVGRDENDSSEETLYNTAAGIGIKPEYVERVLRMQCPSREEQFAACVKLGATFEASALRTMIGNHLFNAVQNAYPLSKFHMSLSTEDPYFPEVWIRELTEQTKEMGLFRKKKITVINESPIMQLYINAPREEIFTSLKSPKSVRMADALDEVFTFCSKYASNYKVMKPVFQFSL